MIWATKNNERLKAIPKERANCDLCNEEVIAKCGEIKIWHWSHKKDFVCDSFGEQETKWHIDWKNEFPKEMQEVIIGNHRADILNKRFVVIELQNSPISPKEIEEREKFYDNMVWILNGETIAKNFSFFYKKEYFSFKWKWFPKSLIYITKPLYIDLNEGVLFRIRRLTKPVEGIGWGKLISKEKFLEEFL